MSYPNEHSQVVVGELGFITHLERLIEERDDEIDIGQLGSSNFDALMLAALDAYRASIHEMRGDKIIKDNRGNEVVLNNPYRYVVGMPGPDSTLVIAKEFTEDGKVICYDVYLKNEAAVSASALFQKYDHPWDDMEIRQVKEAGGNVNLMTEHNSRLNLKEQEKEKKEQEAIFMKRLAQFNKNASHYQFTDQAFTLHMGEATKKFEELKLSPVSSGVRNPELGVMGATSYQLWTSRLGGTLLYEVANGGCSLTIIPDKDIQEAE